ncbi:MAG: serine/threonine protein kinase [Phormidium sp.]|nr:MAG: serine/threonine protein kinase, bacterial [Phormidium sp. OSCR]
MNVRAGTLLNNGKYAIEATLGQGYFGATYRATHGQLWQPVILKSLGDSLLSHPNRNEFARQFVEQARQLARCQQANVPRVLDLFEEHGQPFLVLDYICGTSLRELVEGQGRRSPQEALTYLQQLATAVETLHHQGLLHRDLKPEHGLQVSGSDRLVLIEVGLTRDLTTGAGQTYSGLLSPGYAAPEQYSGATSSPATDVYSLAATGYYLLTGQPPASAPLRDRVPLSPLSDGSPLADALEEAIFRGLDLNPETRPATIRDWCTWLPDATGYVNTNANSRQLRQPSHLNPASELTEARPIFQRPWVPALFATTSIVAAIGGAAAMMNFRSAMSTVPQSEPVQQPETRPRAADAPQPRQRGNHFSRQESNDPILEVDAWTPIQPTPDAEYTGNPWQEDGSAQHNGSSWSNSSSESVRGNPRDPYTDTDPYQDSNQTRYNDYNDYNGNGYNDGYPDEDPYADEDSLLSDKTFTEERTTDEPIWSEPVPESLERPWGQENNWERESDAKLIRPSPEDSWNRDDHKGLTSPS